MGHYHARDFDGEIAVAELVEVKQVGSNSRTKLAKKNSEDSARSWGASSIHSRRKAVGRYRAVKKVHPRGLIEAESRRS